MGDYTGAGGGPGGGIGGLACGRVFWTGVCGAEGAESGTETGTVWRNFLRLWRRWADAADRAPESRHGGEVVGGIGFGGGMTTAPVAKTAISAVAASVGRCRNAGNGAVEPDRVDRHDRLRAVRRRALPRGA